MNLIQSKKALCIIVAMMVFYFLFGYIAHAEMQKKVIPIGKTIDFRHPFPYLKYYLKHTETQAPGPHHFCVVAYERRDNDRIDQWAYVLWQEGQQLILWEAGRGIKHSYDSLITTRRSWDISPQSQDIADDPQGSTYIETPEFVAELKRDCQRYGKKIILK